MKKSFSGYSGDEAARSLLQQYRCPVPFHTVRTRFLGVIASPRPDASPQQVVHDLWQGGLAELDDIDAVEVLVRVLIGLWDDLTRHRSQARPFHLTRGPFGFTEAELGRLCRTRTEEIAGFAAGFFGTEEDLELPRRAGTAFDRLNEINAILSCMADVLEDGLRQSSSEADLAAAFQNVTELTRFAEREMQAIVIACRETHARMLSQLAPATPTVH